MNTIKTRWNIMRTAFFYFIGLLNTVFIAEEELWTWKHYLGYAFFAMAIADTIYLVYRLRKKKINE